jgi:diacylglycerol kinase
MSENNFKNGCFKKSLLCALNGLIFGMKERNIKTHLTFFILVVFLGAALDISTYEWLAIFIVSAGVFSLELVNTAIEEICDRLRDDLGLCYESTRKARDVAAGAVLATALLALLCGVVIFLPRMFMLVYRFLI